MMNLPDIPALDAGHVATADEMNALAYACTFGLTKPVAQVVASTARAIGTSPGAVQFDSANFDYDGMWSATTPARLTISTPGWYKARYSIVTGNTQAYNTFITSTTGSGNPQGPGINSPELIPGYAVGISALPATGISASRPWPYYLYSGDYLQVWVFASAANSTAVTPCGSTFSLEYVSI